MKYNTFHKMNFTAEYWNYVTSQDPLSGNPIQTYTKTRDIKCSLLSAEKGVMYLLADDQLRYNAQIRELTDPSGKLVFADSLTGESQIAYVGISEPMFDVWGNIIGYRHDIAQGLE